MNNENKNIEEKEEKEENNFENDFIGILYHAGDILDDPLMQEAVEEWHKEDPRISSMIVCETEFEIEDRNKKGYSMTEIDYYMWIPKDIQQQEKISDHRLSLRKNLKENKYEVYRHYHATKSEEIVISTITLAEALKNGDAEWNHFHFGWSNTVHKDIVCDHKTNRASGCRVNYMDLITPLNGNENNNAEI